jgi:hypothetical protein
VAYDSGGRSKSERAALVVNVKHRAIFLCAALLALACGQAFGFNRRKPQESPAIRRRTLRRLLWNPQFRPSRNSLVRQNQEIDRQQLPRIKDEAELEQLKASRDLVAIQVSPSLRFDPRLDPSRRYCRPWTRDFLNDLSEAYYKEFNSQIQVNSAVRTVRVQKKLRRHNRNAAPENGETASSHLAGVTVDIQRRGMTARQILWTEAYMLPIRDLGLIEPEEERHQWVFHVMVSRRYADWRESKMLAGDSPNNGTSRAPGPVSTN